MFKNIIQSLITKGAIAIINFCILIISSKYLGVSSRGEISIFILNIIIIQAINEVYTGYSVVHFIPKFNLRKMIIGGLVYTLIFCSLSNIFIVFLNKQVAGYEWWGYLVSFLIIINTFNCIIILGKEKIKAYNLMGFLQPFLLLTGMGFCLFVLRIFTFESYIFPLIFSFAIAAIISSVVVIGLLITANKKANNDFQLRPILINGLVFQANVLMFVFCNRYSYYLLPSTAKVGLYSSASAIAESVLIIVNGIAPVLIAKAANKGNTRTIANLALSLSKLSFVFSCMAIVGLFLIPGSFYVRILGNGFVGIKHLMFLYAPGILLVSFFATIGNYFSSIGKQKYVVYSYACGFVFTLLCAPLFIDVFDMEGAAYTATLSYLIITVVICITFVRMNRISFGRFFSFKEDIVRIKRILFLKSL